MSSIPPNNPNKYREGAYEVFGYQTRDDDDYAVFRNCVACVEAKPDTRTLAKTVFGHEKYPKDNIKTAAFTNALTAIGYVPGIGLFPGVINIVRGSLRDEVAVKIDPKTDKSLKRAAIIKGIFQACGFGVIFLPTDLWVTAQRRRNPPDFNDLLNRTRHIESGKVPSLDRLRESSRWSQ